MRLTLDNLRRQRAPIMAAAERWGAHHLRVFGSVARGAAVESLRDGGAPVAAA